jgi:NAD(P)-dependent dehydrogenase (short-subunit alcohol dehydrogenase family)
MRSLAVELARHRIRCNALLPGWTDTAMLADARSYQKFVDNTVARTPVRRWATPTDFAEAAVFLADPSITFHTGDTVVVDGGYTVF